MLIVLAICLVAVGVNTLIHYEVLRKLNDTLPRLEIPGRSKLLVVIFATFFAHLIEMAVWGAFLYALVLHGDVGTLMGDHKITLLDCIYFSAETYTSLGFGDIRPHGDLRLLVGVEALNGLLLIAWSASFTYLSMERFWSLGKGRDKA